MENERLQLSGIQHFKFCRRQWALIHLENQWKDNVRTVDGILMHKRAHDASLREHRGNVLILRDLSVFSDKLNLSGKCDIVEFRSAINGITLAGEEGRWVPYPVEYKRGEPKSGTEDKLQLCAQAMCLEEMLCCDIKEGALFYGETKRRLKVVFDEELRSELVSICNEMQGYYSRKYTPMPRRTKACNACSMKELCLPALGKIQTVEDYIKMHIMDEDESE